MLHIHTKPEFFHEFGKFAFLDTILHAMTEKAYRVLDKSYPLFNHPGIIWVQLPQKNNKKFDEMIIYIFYYQFSAWLTIGICLWSIIR